MRECSTFDARRVGSLISRLAGDHGGRKRAKHRGGSKFRTKVNQEVADPKLQPEDAHAACVACVVPQFITWLASSRRNGLMWSMTEPGNDPLNWSDTAVGQLQAICIAKFRGTRHPTIYSRDNVEREKSEQVSYSIVCTSVVNVSI